MNNKGFTLIEIITTLTIIALVLIIIISISSNTLSLSDEKAYELTKSNIINATDKYILECNNKLINCNLTWNDNKTIVMADNLVKAGYFRELKNPVNDKDLQNCLTIEVEKQQNSNKYIINDKKCK